MMLAMHLSVDEAVKWTEALVAWAALTSTIELLALHRQFADNGLWSPRFLFPARHQASRRWNVTVHRLFGRTATLFVLGIRFLAALALPCTNTLWSPLLLLVTTFWLAFRWRGSVNGGSDTMSVQLAICLCVQRFGPDRDESNFIALTMIVSLLASSYVVAGLAKLLEPAWRNGRALDFFLVHHPLSRGRALAHLLRSRRLLLAASWSLLAFEISFPCAFFSPRLAGVYLAIGVGFHVTNALLFGLYRFVWIWIATYPALYWFALEGRERLQVIVAGQ
jgi:hypothetical protein